MFKGFEVKAKTTYLQEFTFKFVSGGLEGMYLARFQIVEHSNPIYVRGSMLATSRCPKFLPFNLHSLFDKSYSGYIIINQKFIVLF